MFMGKLGTERSFIVMPRGVKDFHLPTDLLGLTPAQFDPNRSDDNLVAALGPACNKIRTAMQKLGPFRVSIDATQKQADGSTQTAQTLNYNDADLIALLETWIDANEAAKNFHAIHFANVDAELNLPNGTAKRLIAQAGKKHFLKPAYDGALTIKFELDEEAYSRSLARLNVLP
jgi:hypothetical protein